ncbi:MAG TPA: hypothetical protein VFZ87_01940, partial [Gemmatimonadales bacterium]
DRPIGWEATQPAVASVTAGGVLTAAAPGVSVIRATVEGAVDTVAVVVRTLQFQHVHAGPSLSCGLEASGEAWCWGKVGPTGHGNGSLDTTRQDVPKRAAVGHTFTSLAFTPTSTCGIAASGSVVCWGQNESGQLGDGTTTPRGTPAPVSGLTDIVELAAGWSHFCARSGAGVVRCWGSNEWSQTGQPNHGIVSQPSSVALAGPATGITLGQSHSCALVAGQSFCWGSDVGRELGNDTTYNRLVPAPAATGDGVSRTWSEVEASNDHTCGRDSSGLVLCWGALPSGLYPDKDTLAWVPTPRFDNLLATDMAGGWEVQCAVTNQRALCDGYELPRVELAGSNAVVSVVVAGSRACILQTDGGVRCELGTEERGTLTPVALPAPAVQIAASDGQVCALDNLSAVYCWSLWDRIEPQRVFETVTVIGVYANSGSRICVIAESSTVSCRDLQQQTETTEPTGGLSLVALGVGDYHTCGITADGAAWCWGENTYGQLGDGTTTNRTSAVAVQGGRLFSQITAGLGHTCGLTTAGAIYCWGYGSSGSMGDNLRDESAAPVSVDGTPSLTQLGADISVPTCGLDGAGSVWCWPTSFAVPAVHQIAGAAGLASLTRTCGLRATGEMLCWGNNYAGRFGNGLYGVENLTAVAGGNGIRFAEVSFGTGSACGISIERVTYCWGDNSNTSVGSPEARGDIAALPLKLYGSP